MEYAKLSQLSAFANDSFFVVEALCAIFVIVLINRKLRNRYNLIETYPSEETKWMQQMAANNTSVGDKKLGDNERQTKNMSSSERAEYLYKKEVKKRLEESPKKKQLKSGRTTPKVSPYSSETSKADTDASQCHHPPDLGNPQTHCPATILNDTKYDGTKGKVKETSGLATQTGLPIDTELRKTVSAESTSTAEYRTKTVGMTVSKDISQDIPTDYEKPVDTPPVSFSSHSLSSSSYDKSDTPDMSIMTPKTDTKLNKDLSKQNIPSARDRVEKLDLTANILSEEDLGLPSDHVTSTTVSKPISQTRNKRSGTVQSMVSTSSKSSDKSRCSILNKSPSYSSVVKNQIPEIELEDEQTVDTDTTKLINPEVNKMNSIEEEIILCEKKIGGVDISEIEKNFFTENKNKKDKLEEEEEIINIRVVSNDSDIKDITEACPHINKLEQGGSYIEQYLREKEEYMKQVNLRRHKNKGYINMKHKPHGVHINHQYQSPPQLVPNTRYNKIYKYPFTINEFNTTCLNNDNNNNFYSIHQQPQQQQQYRREIYEEMTGNITKREIFERNNRNINNKTNQIIPQKFDYSKQYIESGVSSNGGLGGYHQQSQAYNTNRRFSDRTHEYSMFTARNSLEFDHVLSSSYDNQFIKSSSPFFETRNQQPTYVSRNNQNIEFKEVKVPLQNYSSNKLASTCFYDNRLEQQGQVPSAQISLPTINRSVLSRDPTDEELFNLPQQTQHAKTSVDLSFLD